MGPEPLASRIGPGDLVGLDMRAPWMDESMAMALFTVSMSAFAQARHKVHDEHGQEREQPFRKMIIFDEAHKYMVRGTLSADILKMVREMRHRQMWVSDDRRGDGTGSSRGGIVFGRSLLYSIPPFLAAV